MRHSLICLASLLVACAGCSSRDDADREEKLAALARAKAEAASGPRLSYSQFNLTKPEVRGRRVAVWTDGSTLLPRSHLDVYIGFEDLSVLDGGEVIARVSCPTIGAGRTEYTVPVRAANLVEWAGYPGVLVLRDSLGVGSDFSHPNTVVGEHEVKLQLIGPGQEVLASATLPIRVSRGYP
jgi:hypothetical protein